MSERETKHIGEYIAMHFRIGYLTRKQLCDIPDLIAPSSVVMDRHV